MNELQGNSTTEGGLPKRKMLFLRLKRKFLSHVWLARLEILFGILVGFTLIFVLLSTLVTKTHLLDYAKIAGDFIFTPVSKIKSSDRRVNLLIMGKAGAEHAGADLTDTMIFTSISLVNPKIVLISIPRDIWISAIRAKINSAYYWGNQKEPGGGLTLAKSTVEEIVGQPVHYGLVLDFNGFMQIIDVLGGINLTVERAFVDEKYPIAGRENDLCGGDTEFKCRYEILKFEAGGQKMDGETALKFVRSRNAQGDEGTDLAREARQTKVITAIREKVFTAEVLLSPPKLFGIWRVLKDSMVTDLGPSEAAIVIRRLIGARNNIGSNVLSEEFLENPPISGRYDNQYVFIPKAGNWKEVQAWVASLVKN